MSAPDLASILRRCAPGVVLTDEEVAVLDRAAAEDTGGCTDWSCPYHGRSNHARAVLAALARNGDPRVSRGPGMKA